MTVECRRPAVRGLAAVRYANNLGKREIDPQASPKRKGRFFRMSLADLAPPEHRTKVIVIAFAVVFVVFAIIIITTVIR